MWRLVIVLLVVLFSSVTTINEVESTPITERNWSTHPEIVAISVIANDVELDILTKQLQHEHVNARTKNGTSDILLDFFRDKQGTRKMIADWAFPDSFMTYRYYYDDRGILRLTIVSATARNGTSKEYRIYFDDAGKQIWKNVTTITGPGYKFPDDDLHIVINPDEILRLVEAREPYPEQ